MSLFLLLIQLTVTIITGVFFYTQLRNQKRREPVGRRESTKEMENLRRMRGISLSEPLAEHVRPRAFSDIIGQEEGIKSLMAILCGENPQHVIIYGPAWGRPVLPGWCWRRRKKARERPLSQMLPLSKWTPPVFDLMSGPLRIR